MSFSIHVEYFWDFFFLFQLTQHREGCKVGSWFLVPLFLVVSPVVFEICKTFLEHRQDKATMPNHRPAKSSEVTKITLVMALSESVVSCSEEVSGDPRGSELRY